MDKTAQMLFDYLRDVLYHPDKATLDIEALPEDFRQLGEGMVFFAQMLSETRTFAKDLSKGNLSASFPSRNNELAAPLKALHAALRHMTWQSQQVAKGDYNQHIDFMGKFADAFNTMTEQLDSRQKALMEEIESGRQKTKALEQSVVLLEALTDNISQSIVVMSRKDQTRLFSNRRAKQTEEAGGHFAKELEDWLLEDCRKNREDHEQKTEELELSDGLQKRFYEIDVYPLVWRRQDAYAYVINDVSDEKMRVKKLENYAYQDNLTKLYNRYYGMNVLEQWLREHQSFSLCFVDLDNLKFVNDTYGHIEGDRYIRAAARQMRNFSDDVVVSRLGGDEFMLLAPGIAQAAATERMAELRAQLLAWQDEAKPYLRSVSYGVIHVAEDNTALASELLAQADEKMYAFKREHKQQRNDLIAERNIDTATV